MTAGSTNNTFRSNALGNTGGIGNLNQDVTVECIVGDPENLETVFPRVWMSLDERQMKFSVTGRDTNILTYTSNFTTVVKDLFDRADDALTIGTADTLQVWTNESGVMGIIDNKAYPVISNSHAVIDASVSDCSMSVVLSELTSDSMTPRLFMRYQDNSNHIWIERRLTSMVIRTRVAGTATFVAEFASDYIDGELITVTLIGDSISINQNACSVGTTTITDFLTETKFGIGAVSTEIKFDKFRVLEYTP